MLDLGRRRFAGEGRLPLNPVQQRLAARAQGTAGSRGQHGSIDLHLLIKGAEFYGSNDSIVGVKAQGEGHVAENMLWPEVYAFPCVCYQLYVGYGWVACDKVMQTEMANYYFEIQEKLLILDLEKGFINSWIGSCE